MVLGDRSGKAGSRCVILRAPLLQPHLPAGLCASEHQRSEPAAEHPLLIKDAVEAR